MTRMSAYMPTFALRRHEPNNSAELVTKGLADPRIGHHAVVKVEVGAADAGSGDLHDRITRMLGPWHGPLVDADPIRSAIVHGAHLPSSRKSIG